MSVVSILKKIHLYYPLRYSSLYEYYLKKKNPSRLITEKEESAFLSKLIPTGQLVFDIGANKGEYTRLYLKLGSTVVAAEPDRSNIEVLSVRFKKNSKVTLLDKAISNKIGREELFINEDGSGFNTMSEKWKMSLKDPAVNRWKNKHEFIKSYEIQTTTIDEMITTYGTPFFIKIDVEGYEYNVISSLNIRINLLNFEANLPEFQEETILCVEHLAKIYDGYQFNISDNNRFVFDNWKNWGDFSDYVKTTDRRYLDIWLTAEPMEK